MPNHFVSPSRASSTMPSLWSDLPVDLLVSIKNKLHHYDRNDLSSFRLVCSQWRSAIPTPNPYPSYTIIFDHRDNVIFFYSTDCSLCTHKISPKFSTSSRLKFIFPSNGWLVFLACDNKALHLFNPVSNQILAFPPLFPNIFLLYTKLNPTAAKPTHLFLSKAVVSSSASTGVAVAGILELSGGISHPQDRRLVFCRHGDGHEWSLLMEGSGGISDVALAGNGCFYAISEDWELYMLEERPPLIRLRRLRLWLPKQMLQGDPQNDPTDEGACPCTVHCCVEASGESELRICGSHWTQGVGGRWICLKLDVTKLRCRGGDIDAACEAVWTGRGRFPNYIDHFFTPSVQKLSPKVEEKDRGVTQSSRLEFNSFIGSRIELNEYQAQARASN